MRPSIERINHSHVYISLAFIVTLSLFMEYFVFEYFDKIESGTYDLAVKHRIFKRAADPNIVIIDIDEASLEGMAQEFGRWPWPRELFAEFVENLQQQQPKAIVFDIIFSDPDIYNAGSDAYFNEVIGQYDNLYFPMLRLPEQNDTLSEIRPSMIAGLTPIPEAVSEDQPLAVVLPFLRAAQDSGRMGTINIYADDDGICRTYTLRHEHDGWKIPSLPAKIAEQLNRPLPEDDELLLNWRGKLNSFKSVSFVALHKDFLRRDKQRLPTEFQDKIVIIGSTAPGLFDFKPTPMNKTHPGVEILATAIDNTLRQDFIQTPKTLLLPILLSIALIWGTALAFIFEVNHELIDKGYGITQGILVGIAVVSINFSDYYLDLSLPVLFGLGYFVAAKIYASFALKMDTRLLWEKKMSSAGNIGIGIFRPFEEDRRRARKMTACVLKTLRTRFKNIKIELLDAEPIGITLTFDKTYFLYVFAEQQLETFTTEAVTQEVQKKLAEQKIHDARFRMALDVLNFTDNEPMNRAHWMSSVTLLLHQAHREVV